MTNQNSCRNCPVWKQSLFKDFDDDLIEWLSKRKKFNTYNKKDKLFSQGDTVDGIYCHLSGLAKVEQTDGNNNIRFSRLVLPGDTSGHRSLFIEQRYKGTAIVASKELTACFVPQQDVLHLLAHNPNFAKNLVIRIANELHRSEQDQIEVKEKSVRGRLAKLLCELGDNYSDKIGETQYLIKSEVSKIDISRILSVAHETIIRLMSEFKSDDIISYQDKRILIKDLHRIKLLSNC